MEDIDHVHSYLSNKRIAPILMFIILKEVTKVLGVGGEVNQNWEIYPAGLVVLGWVVRPRHSLRSSIHPGRKGWRG